MAKFLIVDDEQEVCESFATALSQAGFAVRTCQDGTSAIELYRRERADLVFCDLKLPGLDGLSVLEALKGIDPWATIIVVTSYGSVDGAARAMRLGAYDFIEKPCTLSQIQQLAQRALEHRHKLRDLALLQGKPGTASDLPSRLAEVEQLKTDFLKLLIEELRGPFRLLDDELKLAQSGFYGSWSEVQEKFLEKLKRVQTLLSRLLLGSVSLFMSQGERVTARSIDITRLIEETLKELESRYQEQHLTLKANLPTEPLVGPMDAEKLAWIVQELLENAIHFTPPGGSIELLLVPEAKGFRLHVNDTGCGTPEEEQKQLFNLSRGKKDCLGLPLVHHYVGLLNGSIALRSHPGQGNQFTVTLPWWEQTLPLLKASGAQEESQGR